MFAFTSPHTAHPLSPSAMSDRPNTFLLNTSTAAFNSNSVTQSALHVVDGALHADGYIECCTTRVPPQGVELALPPRKETALTPPHKAVITKNSLLPFTRRRKKRRVTNVSFSAWRVEVSLSMLPTTVSRRELVNLKTKFINIYKLQYFSRVNC